MFVFHHLSNCSMFLAPSSVPGLYRGILLMPTDMWQQCADDATLQKLLLSRFGAHIGRSTAEHLARQMGP